MFFLQREGFSTEAFELADGPRGDQFEHAFPRGDHGRADGAELFEGGECAGYRLSPEGAMANRA